MKKTFLYGVMASFFFAFTHILNRSMQLGGGYWMWSASLRYLSSLPFLAVLVWREKGFRRLFGEIADNLAPWFLWSNVGFGLFYAALTFAVRFGILWNPFDPGRHARGQFGNSYKGKGCGACGDRIDVGVLATEKAMHHSVWRIIAMQPAMQSV